MTTFELKEGLESKGLEIKSTEEIDNLFIFKTTSDFANQAADFLYSEKIPFSVSNDVIARNFSFYISLKELSSSLLK